MTINYIKWLIFATIFTGIVAYLMVYRPWEVSGWDNEQYVICHVPLGNEENPQTLYLSEEGAENHLENHELDYEGPCEEEYVTPYSTPYEYPTPGEYETPYSYPTPYSTPYVTPYATPVSVEQALTPAGPPLCVAEPVQHAPTINEVKRLSPDSVSVSWSTTDTNRFHVYYGFVGQSLIWNTLVNGQSTTLNDLPEDSPLDVKVCSIGQCGDELCGLIVDP